MDFLDEQKKLNLFLVDCLCETVTCAYIINIVDDFDAVFRGTIFLCIVFCVRFFIFIFEMDQIHLMICGEVLICRNNLLCTI